MKIDKNWQKVTLAVAVSVVIVAVLAMALCIPRTGDKIPNIWAVSDPFDINSIATVEKSPSEEFKLLVMADLQLWSNLSDNKKTFELMDKLIEQSRPHMIALVGDNVSGLTTSMLTKQFINKMESYGIPWAPVFGNHDAEGNATLEWQGDRFEKAEHCLFSKGPTNLYGVGNYAVNIKENDKIVQTLYFFDNGRYYNYGDKSTEIYMGYEQIAWYKWNVQNINAVAGYTVPSMTFSHFSPPEFRTAIETFCPKDENDIYRVPSHLGYGHCQYLPSVAPVNSGFIDTAKELGSTKYVFVGHDHENTASIDYEGIRYTFALKTGPSPRYWNNATEYGATLVSISETVSLENIVLWNKN